MMAYKKKLTMHFCFFAGGPDDDTSIENDSSELFECDSDSD